MQLTSAPHVSMDDVVHPEPDLPFEFEEHVKYDIGLKVHPYPEICRDWLSGRCPRGNHCPYIHDLSPAAPPACYLNNRYEKSVVCKHWLRGLCKKGDDCEFLHEYNMKRMPECWFYSKYGECSNAECMYLHIDPDAKTRDCAWYARGFCKHGSACRHRHVRQAACPFYLAGFCPRGPNCPIAHPKYEVPSGRQFMDQDDHAFSSRMDRVVCFRCNERGHYATKCPNVPPR